MAESRMSQGKSFIENVLRHYSSPYYDPQKAHDYYERTKVLADKNAASALSSKEQRDTFAVSRENIAKAKVADVKSLQTDTQTHQEALNKTAQETVDRINQSLQDLATKLRAQVKDTQVNPIPNDATPAQRAFLERQNDQIRAAAANNANTQFGSTSRQSTRDRAKISSDLSTALATARDGYRTAMDALNTKYTNITATEKQNIHNQVAGAPAKKPVKRKTRK